MTFQIDNKNSGNRSFFLYVFLSLRSCFSLIQKIDGEFDLVHDGPWFRDYGLHRMM